MMNREILSLLVIGAFYRPEYIQNSSSTNVGNQMASVLTSTVSGQLNNMLSQISDKFNVGVNAVLTARTSRKAASTKWLSCISLITAL